MPISSESLPRGLNHDRAHTLLRTSASSLPLRTLFQPNPHNSLPYHLDLDLTKAFNSYPLHTAKILPQYHLRNYMGFAVILSFQLYTPTSGALFQTTHSVLFTHKHFQFSSGLMSTFLPGLTIHHPYPKTSVHSFYPFMLSPIFNFSKLHFLATEASSNV